RVNADSMMAECHMRDVSRAGWHVALDATVFRALSDAFFVVNFACRLGVALQARVTVISDSLGRFGEPVWIVATHTREILRILVALALMHLLDMSSDRHAAVRLYEAKVELHVFQQQSRPKVR